MYQNKIVLGSAQFGNKYGISNKSEVLKKRQCFKILKFCYKKKINFIDTANNYGESEEIIGNYLKNFNKQKWNIATKINLNKSDKIEFQIKNSIKKLGKSPSILYFHYFNDYLNKNKRKIVFSLCKKYKIKKIGISIHKINDIKKIFLLKKISVIQIPINILDQRFIKKEVLKFCKIKNIKIYARSVFLQGMFFLKKYKNCNNETKKKLYKITEIIDKSDTSLAELSYIWVKNLKFVNKIIIGVDNLRQIKQNLKIKKNKEKVKLIKKILRIKIEDNKFLSPYKWRNVK